MRCLDRPKDILLIKVCQQHWYGADRYIVQKHNNLSQIVIFFDFLPSLILYISQINSEQFNVILTKYV